jgi:ribose transport system substrate-binding protein
MKRVTLTTVALAASLLVLTGCATNSSPQPSSSTGAASATVAKPTVTDPSQLKVAYFVSGTNNGYLKASIDEAKKVAAENSFSIDVFDGQFSAQVQFDQMQTALTSGKYNAFAVMSNDGNLECNFLTKDAPAAKIMVTLINQFAVADLTRETHSGSRGPSQLPQARLSMGTWHGSTM